MFFPSPVLILCFSLVQERGDCTGSERGSDTWHQGVATSSPITDCMASGHVLWTAYWFLVTCFLFVFHFRSRVLNSWLHGFRTRVHQQLTAWLPATSSSTADCMASGHVHSTADWLLVTCSLFYFPFPVGLFCSPSDWSTRMLLPPVWFPEIYINNNKKSPLILLPVCTVHCSHR